MRTGQVLVIAASLAIAVAVLRSVPGFGGVVGFAAICGMASIVALAPVGGKTIQEWVPVGTGYVANSVFDRPHRASARIAAAIPGKAPRMFRGLTVETLVDQDGQIGIIQDARCATVTAVVELEGSGFALVSEDERDRRVASWSGLLAAMARDARAIHRLQWIERTLPDSADTLATSTTNNANTPASSSYEELVQAQNLALLRHEAYLACTFRKGVSSSEIFAVVRTLTTRCTEAGLLPTGALSAVGLCHVMREFFDHRPVRRATKAVWPQKVSTSWADVTADGLHHATFWIAEWPRCEVRSDFLIPVFVGADARRTVTVVMAPVPMLAATRKAEQAKTARVAENDLKAKHGFAMTARSEREQEAVEQREQELASGHLGYRFSGYVTISAPSKTDLEDSCRRVEQVAALSRLELRRLYGVQDEALLFALPLGRGCR